MSSLPREAFDAQVLELSKNFVHIFGQSAELDPAVPEQKGFWNSKRNGGARPIDAAWDFIMRNNSHTQAANAMLAAAAAAKGQDLLKLFPVIPAHLAADAVGGIRFDSRALWTQTVYDTTSVVASRKSYNSASSILQCTSEKKIIDAPVHGQQFEMDADFIEHPGQVAIFGRKLLAIGTSLKMAVQQEAVKAVVNVGIRRFYSTYFEHVFPANDSTVIDAITNATKNFGVAEYPDKTGGLGGVVEVCKTNIDSDFKPSDLVLILPQGTTAIVRSTELAQSTSASATSDCFNAPRMFNQTALLEAPVMADSETGEMNDGLCTTTTVGEFVVDVQKDVCPFARAAGSDYVSSFRETPVVSLHTGVSDEISLSQKLNHCGLWDSQGTFVNTPSALKALHILMQPVRDAPNVGMGADADANHHLGQKITLQTFLQHIGVYRTVVDMLTRRLDNASYTETFRDYVRMLDMHPQMTENCIPIPGVVDAKTNGVISDGKLIDNGQFQFKSANWYKRPGGMSKANYAKTFVINVLNGLRGAPGTAWNRKRISGMDLLIKGLSVLEETVTLVLVPAADADDEKGNVDDGYGPFVESMNDSYCASFDKFSYCFTESKPCNALYVDQARGVILKCDSKLSTKTRQFVKDVLYCSILTANNLGLLMLVQMDVPVPMNFIMFRMNIEVCKGSVIMLDKNGVGAAIQTRRTMTIGRRVSDRKVSFDATQQVVPVVVRPNQVAYHPAVTARVGHCGGGNTICDPHDPVHRSYMQHPSRSDVPFSIQIAAIPLACTRLADVIDASGKFHPNASSESATLTYGHNARTDLHFPTAEFYKKLWYLAPSDPFSRAEMQFGRSMNTNTVCVRTSQTVTRARRGQPATDQYKAGLHWFRKDSVRRGDALSGYPRSY